MLPTAKLSRRHFTRTLAAALALPHFTKSQTGSQLRRPRFNVFSLFRPQCLMLQSEAPLILHLNQTDAGAEFHRIPPAVLVQISTRSGNQLEISSDNLTITAKAVRLTSTSGEDAAFTLAVPPPALHGTIRRRFQGTLEVRSILNELQAVLTMDTEAATASIVHAESPPEASPAYLQAQAIVSRSFLFAANAGHHGFDFCDTTHCQFLREPPPTGSAAAIATRATMNLHLTFEDRSFAAMYSRSCGGHTHTLADLGLRIGNYPYYAVDCPFCLEHPEKWRREITIHPARSGNASPSIASMAGPCYLLTISYRTARPNKAEASAMASAFASLEPRPWQPADTLPIESSPTSTPTQRFAHSTDNPLAPEIASC